MKVDALFELLVWVNERAQCFWPDIFAGSCPWRDEWDGTVFLTWYLCRFLSMERWMRQHSVFDLIFLQVLVHGEMNETAQCFWPDICAGSCPWRDEWDSTVFLSWYLCRFLSMERWMRQHSVFDLIFVQVLVHGEMNETAQCFWPDICAGSCPWRDEWDSTVFLTWYLCRFLSMERWMRQHSVFELIFVQVLVHGEMNETAQCFWADICAGSCPWRDEWDSTVFLTWYLCRFLSMERWMRQHSVFELIFVQVLVHGEMNETAQCFWPDICAGSCPWRDEWDSTVFLTWYLCRFLSMERWMRQHSVFDLIFVQVLVHGEMNETAQCFWPDICVGSCPWRDEWDSTVFLTWYLCRFLSMERWMRQHSVFDLIFVQVLVHGEMNETAQCFWPDICAGSCPWRDEWDSTVFLTWYLCRFLSMERWMRQHSVFDLIFFAGSCPWRDEWDGQVEGCTDERVRGWPWLQDGGP